VWRYSRIDDLDLDRFEPSVAPPGSRPGSAADALAGTPAGGWLEELPARAGLIVVRDGLVVGCELSDEARRQGVLAGSLLETPDASDVLGAARAPDAFVELATAFMPDVAAIVFPPRVVLEQPVLVVHLAGLGDEGPDTESGRANGTVNRIATGRGPAALGESDGQWPASFPRTVVRIGRAAEASVVEVAVSGEGPVLTVPTVDLDVSDDARLSYVGIQDLGRTAWQLGYQVSRVGRDGHLSSFSVALGGSYARLRTDSRLAGQGGASNLLAAYFGDGEQMHDFRTMQDHEAPKTSSDLLFKGAVADEARSVYSGLIRVRRGAVGTNAFQTNRNLVLSEGARAHSVPNLDIAENDVRCSHASAVGPIDPDHRYYLESRGIPREVADRLIVLGFFDDILERAPVAGVRSWLRSAVARRATGGRGRLLGQGSTS
jgi:Fe-S cluster assembly protein SufD